MPAATAAFDEPFPFDADRALRLLELEDCFALVDGLRALLPELRELELRLRDDAEEVRRLEALPLRVLLREAVDLLPLRLFEPPLFGLDPFELREPVCRLLVERVLPWAIAPP
jgi:hypothetical protein